MTYKAPKHLQELGLNWEQEGTEILETELRKRGSKIIVERGSADSKENGEFGDALFKTSPVEMEICSAELKASTRPLSFSLSDYEKRCSVARWVIVLGPRGVWCVTMAVAREHLTERVGDDGKKYWTSQPPFEEHVTLDRMLDDIQCICGEHLDKKL